MRRSNIIMLGIDEIRPVHLNRYGYQRITTTNIDSVAEEEALFDTCIAQDALAL